jgi:dienelactone hydrolase
MERCYFYKIGLMKRTLLFLFFALPLFLLGQPQPQSYTTQSLTYKGNGIGFYQYLPPGYDPTGAKIYPVIIYFHGQQWVRKGSNLTAELYLVNNDGLPKHLDTGATMSFSTSYGQDAFIVLIPQKKYDPEPVPGQTYTQEKQWDQYYVDAMINYAQTSLRADLRRVFLTGSSLGAGITWDYSSFNDTTAAKIAGIVPVSGQPVYAYDSSASGGTMAALCNIPEHGIAARAYHGAGDPVIPLANVIRAQRHINDTCPDYPTKVDAQVKSISGQGHAPQFWDLVYDPNYNRNDTSLNMYQWMLEMTSAVGAALPVELDFVKGKNLSEANILEWATSQEESFQRFEVLRSQDGRDYLVIGSINAQGGTHGVKQYSYKDIRAPKGLSHYRLKMIDKDGSFRLSRVISIDNQNRSYTIEKYPNPVLQDLNLVIEGSMFGNIDIAILDLKGNVIRKQQFRKEQARWQGKVNVDALTKGVYILQIQSADGKKDISTFVKR